MSLVRFVAVTIVALLSVRSQAELPPESALPGSSAAPARRLPAESLLPLAPPAAGARVAMQQDLPGEGELPLPAEAPRGDLADDPALRDSPDGLPWLRLNLEGHTAPVRSAVFLTDGKRFCTAGDDKSVLVWSREEGDGPWRHERTIRWQIQRGTRGRIYSLAASGNAVAMAGEGAMGGTGEVVLVDATTGGHLATLFDEANGHRQVVVAMDMLPAEAGDVLASQSMDGRTLLWTKDPQGVWRARVVRADDAQNGSDKAEAERLLAGRAFSAVKILDASRLVVPMPIAGGGRQTWRLEVFDADGRAIGPLGGDAGPRHVGSVTAIAASGDRSRLVSADAGGNVFVWDLTTRPVQARRLSRSRPNPVLSATMPVGGQLVALGTTASADSGQGAVEVWDLRTPTRPRLLRAPSSRGHVLACAVSGDGSRLVYSHDGALTTARLDQDAPLQLLRPRIQTPVRVAFARDAPFYRIGIGLEDSAGAGATLRHVFDPYTLALTRTRDEDASQWLPQDWLRGGWSVAESATPGGQRVWSLQENGQKRFELPLSEQRTGAFRSVCWVPGAAGAGPAFAAIGDSAGGIRVIDLTGETPGAILRRFRGHTSEVVSMAVSRDLRWLVSASADATVRVWSLADLKPAQASASRWGAVFAVADDNRLTIETAVPNGPLYFRGARDGDTLVACEWSSGGRTQRAETPDEILRILNAEDGWDRTIGFELQPGRAQPKRFQILPAWREATALAFDESNEWAYWTPAGYYDASFEGHRLFGWQINRGPQRLPDFFLAARFRSLLERPEVMSRVLTSGSLEQAFLDARAALPGDPSQAIVNAYRLKPEVTILACEEDGAGQRVLRARVSAPAGQRIARIKAFANGVVAPPGRETRRVQEGHDELIDYEWTLAVPADPEVLVQVVAATEQEITAVHELVFEQAPVERAAAPAPRMFVLALGVDHYRDAQIPDLGSPAESAGELVDLLRTRASALYQVESTALVNERVSRPSWRSVAAVYAERLKEDARPDDLVLIFVSGHGVRDAFSDDYYYVTGDADFGEVMGGAYDDCLSFEDLAPFADVSCRKLVILDTCHSGAIQPMRRREMKAAVRALQDDMLITLAASDGQEEAAEGRFARRLLEALRGAADQETQSPNGVVDFKELVAYLQRTIAEDSTRDPMQQTPSAGPRRLVRYISAPLAEARPAQADAVSAARR